MKRDGSVRSEAKIVGVTLLFYRCLLRLGPKTFRQGFGMAAVQDFRQCCRDAYRRQGAFGVVGLWPGMLRETMVGMLAEYWEEWFGRRGTLVSTVRRGMVASFWAVMLFLFGYVALGQIADPVAPFNAVGRIYPEVGIAYTLFRYSGELALLAVLLGGVPILVVVVKRAFGAGPLGVLRLFLIRPKQVLGLLGVAVLIAGEFVGYLVGTEYLFGMPTCGGGQQCAGQVSPGMFVLGLVAIVGVIALVVFVVLIVAMGISVAVLRSEFGSGLLRLVLVPMGVLVVAMGMGTVATAIWTVRLWVDAPAFAASGSGLGYGQTAWVVAIIVAMGVATGVTGGSFVRGVRVWRRGVA